MIFFCELEVLCVLQKRTDKGEDDPDEENGNIDDAGR